MSITRSALHYITGYELIYIWDVLFFIAHRCKYICKIAFVDAAATGCRGLRYEKFVKGIRGYFIRGSHTRVRCWSSWTCYFVVTHETPLPYTPRSARANISFASLSLSFLHITSDSAPDSQYIESLKKLSARHSWNRVLFHLFFFLSSE